MATSEGELHCFSCRTPYKHGAPDPYLLPCLHSLCQPCYDSTEDITCFVCDERFAREGKDLKTLPKDATTAKDIFLWTVEHRGSELLCTNRNDGDQAMCWCQACEAFLCEPCQASHEDMKATKSHKVMSLQELRSQYETVGRSLRCDTHKDHPFTFYDETCKIPICAMCALGKHQECTREELDVTCSNILASLEDKRDALSKRQDVLLATQSANKLHTYKLSEKQDQLAEIITHTFDELQIVLRQREREVKIDLEKCFDNLKQANDQQRRDLDKESCKHQLTRDFIQKCLKMADPIDLLTMKQTIDERTSSCVGSEIPKVEERDGSVVFSRHGLQELRERITSFGAFSTALGTHGSDLHLRLSHGNIILCMPVVAMDKDRLNTSVVHIDAEGFLLHGKDTETGEEGTRNLDKYSGTVSSNPLSVLDMQYWEVKVSLELLQEISRLMLFETGISVLSAVEQRPTVSTGHYTFIMFATHCDSHNTLCVMSREHGHNTRCLKQIMPNVVGERAELRFGFLFNPRAETLVFLDLITEEVLCVMDEIDMDKEYWPVFGVFNGEDARVAMKPVSGSDITIDTTKKKFLNRHCV